MMLFARVSIVVVSLTLSFGAASAIADDIPSGAAAQSPPDLAPVEEVTGPLDDSVGAYLDLSREELQQRLDQVDAQMLEDAQSMDGLRSGLRDTRNEARLASEDVAAILEEINALRRKVEAVVDEIPEIKEMREDIGGREKAMIDLMRERRLILQALNREFEQEPQE